MSLRGFCTINFWADDVPAAIAWYEEFLGIEAYFQRPGPDGRPAYAEFRIGDAGFVTASVVDPFGNVLGVMYNPHYVEIVGASDPA